MTGSAGHGAGARCASLCCAAKAGSGTAARAIGSAGERLVHTEEVTGSIPVSPTTARFQSLAQCWITGMATDTPDIEPFEVLGMFSQ